MMEVDRLMVGQYRIQLKQMMENAGRNLARLAVTLFLSSGTTKKKVAILSGSSGNGGGSLVCARHLSNWDVEVHIYLSKRAQEFSGVPADQLAILREINLPVQIFNQLPDGSFDLVIDGIIGYSLKGHPQGTAAKMIRWANEQSAPVLSLDIPSGIDGSDGRVSEPAVKAAATMTLALPKKGLNYETSRAFVGELFLADIGVPPQLYRKAFGREVDPLFRKSEIVRII